MRLVSILLLCVTLIWTDRGKPPQFCGAEGNESKGREHSGESCELSKNELCPLYTMPSQQSVTIYPGGRTRCIFSTSSPYAFTVTPGDSDKLLVYFQGGGACWSRDTTSDHYCNINVHVHQRKLLSMPARSGRNRGPRGDGRGDGSHLYFLNPASRSRYLHFTVVHVRYCSGDTYMGNTTRDYNDPEGEPVEQRGLENVESVLQWIVAQQHFGDLSSSHTFRKSTSRGIASNLTELVLMGSSAGAIAVQIVATHALQLIAHQKAVVVIFSYIGVFPGNAFGWIAQRNGFCDWYMLSDTALMTLPPSQVSGWRQLRTDCRSGNLTLWQMLVLNAQSNPRVPFAFVESKVDGTQLRFYDYLIKSIPREALLQHYQSITAAEFYRRTSERIAFYQQHLDNVLFYLVNGRQHPFPQDPTGIYSLADAKGPKNGGRDLKGAGGWRSLPTVQQWVEQLPLEPGKSLRSVCVGDAVANLSSAVLLLQGKAAEEYCLADLSTKKYIQLR